MDVPGGYGWIGGIGTAAYVIPSTGPAVIYVSQVEMGGPDDFSTVGAFPAWVAAYR